MPVGAVQQGGAVGGAVKVLPKSPAAPKPSLGADAVAISKSASTYVAPSQWYDTIKSIAVPAFAWFRQNGSSVIRPAANFWKELGVSTLKNNVVSALWYDGVGSVVRNGLALIQGKEKPARAVGNVVADVSIGAGKGIVAGLAVTGATMGLTALGLTVAPFLLGLPIMLGTIGVSMLAYRFMNKADQSLNLHKKVSDGITKLIDKDA